MLRAASAIEMRDSSPTTTPSSNCGVRLSSASAPLTGWGTHVPPVGTAPAVGAATPLTGTSSPRITNALKIVRVLKVRAIIVLLLGSHASVTWRAHIRAERAPGTPEEHLISDLS